mgnify:CR=1 FL=1
MKIESIQLINFRQYRKETIEFSTLENQNLTILQGVNGAGKTNLLNAITWCLYGKEKHIEKKYEGFPIVNTLTLRKSYIGKKIGVGVRIIMREEDGNKIIFERGCEFKKITDSKAKEVGDSVFSMKKQIGKDIESVKDPEYRVNRLIPESIEEYFFFDGERLNDYFRTASGEKIREAVFKISQVGLIENAIKHLKSKKSDFVRKEKEFSFEAKEIKEDLEYCEKLSKDYKKELKELKEQKIKAEKKENEYSEKIGTFPISYIRELENDRRETLDELGKLETDIEVIKQERNDYLIEVFPSIIAYDPIIKMKQLISGKQESGDIPPDFKKNFLEKLLEKGICICGTDISKDNDYRNEIKKLLHDCDEISDISEELIIENVNLISIINNLKDFDKRVISFGKRLKNLEENRKKKSERLQKIYEKLEKTDFEKTKLWSHKIKEYKGIRDGLISKIALLEYDIREKDKEQKKLEKDLYNELNKEKKYKRLLKNLKLCDKSLEALKKTKYEIMEDVRKEIKENTKQQFFDLIWKKKTFKDVNIDENYNISVVDQYGMEGIGTLGAGERQVLALSFIAALNSVSGFNVPIIIDTPLARISKEPKKNIANNLLNYMKGKQVALLVTEEEYTSEVKNRLSERVGREYIIEFIETKEGSEAKAVICEK